MSGTEMEQQLRLAVDLLEEASSLAKPDPQLLQIIDGLAELVPVLTETLAAECLTCPELLSLLAAEHEPVWCGAVKLLSLLGARLGSRLRTALEDPERFLELLDELVYKLSTVAEPSNARSVVRLLMFMMETDEDVLEFFCQKYRGIRPLLKRWQGRGFDLVLKKLGDAVAAGDLELAEVEHRRRAATLIQARYRGHRLRRRLAQATRTIIRLQRRFRLLRVQKQRLRLRREDEERAAFASALRRQQRRRQHAERVLKDLSSISADKVPAFMRERRRAAAVRIQSAWRAHRARRQLPVWQQYRRRHCAAVTLQRWWRHCLVRLRADREGALPFKVTDEDAAKYLRQIDQWVEAALSDGSRPLPSRSQLADQLAQSQTLFGKLVWQLDRGAARRRRCYSLLAQTQAICAQLETPVGQRPLAEYWSPSRQVAARARLLHSRAMAHATAPWWQKLQPFDDGYN